MSAASGRRRPARPARKLAPPSAAWYAISVLRVLLKVLLAAAALAAVWAFVPIHGRTLADRWHRARDASEFVDRAWAEARGEAHPSPRARTSPGGHAPAAPASRTQARTGPQPGRPAESHTDADRKALDRIVSEHLDE